MSHAGDEHTQPQISVSGRIDRACDEFEKALTSGAAARIEDVLAQLPPEQQDKLFGELLEIELDFRQRQGAFLREEEYVRRFVERREQVEAVFRRVVKVRRLGDYELLDELGRGGMGVVYKARQIYLNQIVAVKVLPQRYLDDPQAVARFRREMESIGGLDHPNIVRAFNAGEAGGAHFLVMEYVDGVTLQQMVVGVPGSEAQPLAVGAACEAIRQAALGLEHAYQRQLIHRDVKPANLMLGRAGTVKLLDLGLAKFHAERRDGDASGSLTQPGVTIGTVDYMAPEQWENSSAVDIRSDIYSLGCTLFFLLTGRPPYGEPTYDSNRKKLMAHVVAPIPLVGEYRDDCPEEIEEILAQMMAKEPGERFATPADVADALADFADADELAVRAAAQPPLDHPAAAAHAVTYVDVETARKRPSSSQAKRGSSGRRRIKRTWLRRALPPFSVAVILMLAGWLIVWAANRPDRPPVEPTASFDVAKVQADLTLLPGLNGAWWFEEMPWLMPFVRQAIVDTLGHADDPSAVLGGEPAEYIDPNVADVQKWLWDVISRSRQPLSTNQTRLLDELKLLTDSRLDDEQLAKRLSESLERFVESHEAQWSPADRHALALLEHRVATLKNDRAMAEVAKKSYDEALAGYARAAAPSPLRALCLADSALLCSSALGNFKEARTRFDEALAQPNLPLLFHVETLVAAGAEASACAANAGEYEDHRFVHAKRLLENSEAGKRSHPLAASIDECYAWSLMDQWKVDEAARQFKEAYNIRWTNQREHNPFATIYMLHDRHGTAMTQRYQGNLDSARRVYKSIVDEITAAIEKAEQDSAPAGMQRYRSDLHDRLVNSMERWADCELYGGAASGATVNLDQAVALYDKARLATTDTGTYVIDTCKLAILKLLHGHTEEAAKRLARLDAEKRDILGPDHQRVALVRQLADAVASLKGKDSPRPLAGDGPGVRALSVRTASKALRAFLDQFRLNPEYNDSSRRETLELRLFAAELLLSSELDAGDSQAAAADLKYLDPLLAVFAGRKDTRPFLRRYYELAIRACSKGELVQVAHYILESRMADQQASLRPNHVTLLLFYFSSKENFALFLPQDGRPGKRLPLDITREQVKEAASHGKRLALNDELAKLVREEHAAGRPLEVSWSDTMSRPSEDEHALTDNDWPFADQFDLAALRQGAKGK